MKSEIKIKEGDSVLIRGYEFPASEGKVLKIASRTVQKSDLSKRNVNESYYLVEYMEKVSMWSKKEQKTSHWFDECMIYKIQ